MRPLQSNKIEKKLGGTMCLMPKRVGRIFKILTILSHKISLFGFLTCCMDEMSPLEVFGSDLASIFLNLGQIEQKLFKNAENLKLTVTLSF